MLYVLWRSRIRDGPLDNGERAFYGTYKAVRCMRQKTVLEPVEDDLMIVALLGKTAEPPECQPLPML
jgi:hypothetical protein